MLLTLDDRNALERLAIAHLKAEFPRHLSPCEIYMDLGRVLVVECFAVDALEMAEDILRVLAHRAWEAAGALEIILTLQGSEESHVKTARLSCNRLRFQYNRFECNRRLMQTMIPDQMIVGSLHEPVEPVVLLYEEDLRKTLVENTGFSEEQIHRAIEASTVQRYLLGGRVALPSSAGVQILGEFFERAQMALLGKTPALPVALPMAAEVKKKEPATSTPNNGIGMKKARVTASRKVPEKSGLFKDLTIKLSNYAETLQKALEMIAPGDPQEQLKVAKAMVADPANQYMVALLKKYKERDRTENKVRPSLTEYLKKFIAKVETTTTS